MPDFYEIGRLACRDRADHYLYLDDNYLDVDWSQFRQGWEDEQRYQYEAAEPWDEEFEQ